VPNCRIIAAAWQAYVVAIGSREKVNRLPEGSNKICHRGRPEQQETTMKNFFFAAIAALALSIGVGSAYAAQPFNNGAQASHSAPIFYDTTGG
jgi:hypothetical protein